MKHVKKLASILLALIMVLGLAITAFAAQTYSITIDNALEGETYTAYKIFDLTYSGTNNNPGTTPTAPAPDNTSQHTAYSYTIGSSSEWWNVVTNNYSGTESTFTANNLKFTKTTTGNVWNVEAAAGFSAADFAKLLNENKANKTSAGSAVGTAARNRNHQPYPRCSWILLCGYNDWFSLLPGYHRAFCHDSRKEYHPF